VGFNSAFKGLIIGSVNKIIDKAVVIWAASYKMTDIIRPWSCCSTVNFMYYVVMQHTTIAITSSALSITKICLVNSMKEPELLTALC
jgi:hypothetical protein